MDASAAGLIECPHCGGQVSPAPRCSHCGMRIEKYPWKKKLSKFLPYAVLLTLCLVQFAISRRTPPLLQIAEIRPRMNFSKVRVAGVLESDAQKLRDGTLFFSINDGTGILPVFSPPISDGRLPMKGTRVSAVGYLSIAAGGSARMRTPVGVQLEVLDLPATEIFMEGFSLSDVTSDRAGERVTAYGRVTRVWVPDTNSKAPHKIVLTDSSASLDVVHWLKEPPLIDKGDVVEVRGRVDLYQGRVQLRLWSNADIRQLEEAISNANYAVSEQ